MLRRSALVLVAALLVGCGASAEPAASEARDVGSSPPAPAPADGEVVPSVAVAGSERTGAFVVTPDGALFSTRSSHETFVNKGVGSEYTDDGAVLAWDPALTSARTVAEGLSALGPRMFLAGGVAILSTSHASYTVDLTSGAKRTLMRTWLDDGEFRGMESDGEALFANDGRFVGGFQASGLIRVAPDGSTTKVPIALPPDLAASTQFTLADGQLYLQLDCLRAVNGAHVIEPCAEGGVFRVATAGGTPVKVADVGYDDWKGRFYGLVAVRGTRIAMGIDVLESRGPNTSEVFVVDTSTSTPAAKVDTGIHANGIALTGTGLLVCENDAAKYVRADGTRLSLGPGGCRRPRWHAGRAYWIDDASMLRTAELP